MRNKTMIRMITAAAAAAVLSVGSVGMAAGAAEQTELSQEASEEMTESEASQSGAPQENSLFVRVTEINGNAITAETVKRDMRQRSEGADAGKKQKELSTENLPEGERQKDSLMENRPEGKMQRDSSMENHTGENKVSRQGSGEQPVDEKAVTFTVTEDTEISVISDDGETAGAQDEIEVGSSLIVVLDDQEQALTIQIEKRENPQGSRRKGGQSSEEMQQTESGKAAEAETETEKGGK